MNDTTLEVLQNGYFSNLKEEPVYYKKIHGLFIRFYQNSDNPTQMPEFEDTVLFDSDFLNLPANAVIPFWGEGNILYNCTFKEGQVIELHGSKIELHNCKNVKIRFVDQQIHNIVSDSSELSFDNVNSPQDAARYPLILKTTGGVLNLPNTSEYGDWLINAYGTTIKGGGDRVYYAGLSMTGCTIISGNFVNCLRATGNTIYFNYSSETEITLAGGSFVNNYITFGLPGQGIQIASKVKFNASICIGNEVNGATKANKPIPMETGSYAKSVSGNFNGVSVL